MPAIDYVKDHGNLTGLCQSHRIGNPVDGALLMAIANRKVLPQLFRNLESERVCVRESERVHERERERECVCV
jgi:hypothetical protein